MRLRSLSFAAVVMTGGALLTGCASEPVGSTNEGCAPVFEAGSASNGVDVAAETPFTAPLAVNEPQLTIFGGDGDPAEEGDVVVAGYSLYDGTTGELLETSNADLAASLGRPASQSIVQAVGGELPLGQALLCAQTGSDAVLVASFGSLFGDGISQNGIDPESAAVTIFSIEESFAGRAEGLAKPAEDTMPSVSLASNGRPGVTWGGVAAPTEPASVLSIEGNGPVLTAQDTVVMQYSLFSWGTDTVRQSTWDTAPAQLALPDLLPGFQEALIGQPVGSQILIALPSADGYNDGDLFFVVDVLAVV